MDKKAFNPSVMFSFIWFAAILFHFVCKLTILNNLYPLGFHTYSVFLLGTVIFTIGSYIGKLAFINKQLHQSSETASTTDINNLLRYSLLAIVLIGLPIYIRASFQIFIQSNAEELLKGIRTELSFNDADIGPTKYLVPLSFVVFGINLYCVYVQKRNGLNVFLVVISLLASFTYAFFATGRTMFLILFILYFGITYILSKNFSLRKVLLLTVSFVVIFTAIGLVWYGKGGSEDDSTKENSRTASQVTAIYIVTPLSALNAEIENGLTPDNTGNSSLRFFVKFLKSMKIINESAKVQTVTDEYSFVPYATNVYTYYYHYLKDFGLLYALLMLLLFAFLHTIIFLNALTFKDIRYTLYYAFLLDSVVISFFQDNYLSALSFWIQIVFYVEIIIFINKQLTGVGIYKTNVEIKNK